MICEYIKLLEHEENDLTVLCLNTEINWFLISKPFNWMKSQNLELSFFPFLIVSKFSFFFFTGFFVDPSIYPFLKLAIPLDPCFRLVLNSGFEILKE